MSQQIVPQPPVSLPPITERGELGFECQLSDGRTATFKETPGKNLEVKIGKACTALQEAHVIATNSPNSFNCVDPDGGDKGEWHTPMSIDVNDIPEACEPISGHLIKQFSMVGSSNIGQTVDVPRPTTGVEFQYAPFLEGGALIVLAAVVHRALRFK